MHVEGPLMAGVDFALPASAARHAQVLRLQPGDPLTLFDGSGQDWPGEVLSMGRSEVLVRIGAPVAVDHRELPFAVTLAIGMPANERMDWLVEKATELGAVAIQPLVCERAVLRVQGERAERKQAHWQAVATSAAEQCGRARVPLLLPVLGLMPWLRTLPCAGDGRFVLSLTGGSERFLNALRAVPPNQQSGVCCLSGPEGGLSLSEEAAARAAGFRAVTLGPRVLRAETAPLAVLAALAALFD